MPEDEQEEPDKFDLWVEAHFSAEKAQKIIIGIAVALGLALSIALFVILPTFIAGFFKGIHENYFVRNLVEGGFRIVIFILYLWLCCKQKDVKRLFSYHGAEHKTIFCYEHGKELTVDNVRPESRFHPRCGTSFLFVVIIISILVNSVVTVSNTAARMNRHTTGNEIRALFAKLRARIPNLVLRTSLIAGLPGEGESEFDALCAFLRETKIERVGVFPFSPEEGTPAAAMQGCNQQRPVRAVGGNRIEISIHGQRIEV